MNIKLKKNLLTIGILLGVPNWVFAHGNIGAQNLRGIKAPETFGLLGKTGVVVDQQAAIQLGKALFWDTNVGSNGVACASCHFHAGSDRRTQNQLNTGQLHSADSASASSFNIASGITEGVNYDLKSSDFPLFRFSDPNDKTSEILFASDDVIGSAGTFLQRFNSVNETGDSHDNCAAETSDIFHYQGLNSRQVTKRNAPTVINAAFNYRNFWDGRANNIFNGKSAFGLRDTGAKVWVAKNPNKPKQTSLALANASLASQAVAPPLDMIEMSCQQRTFQDIGKKLSQRKPLESQQVHAEDSVLAGIRDASGYGLNTTYGDLVKKAFAKQFWQGSGDFGASGAGKPYSQLEANFSLFFGLAIQLYENTLISDKTSVDEPLDEYGFPQGMTDEQQRGLVVFNDAHCANCHSGPTFSAAVNPQVYDNAPKKNQYYKLVDRTVLTEQSDEFGVDRTLLDIGFADTSVVPNDHDIGLGGTDPYGNPLSFVEQYLQVLTGKANSMIDPVKVVACDQIDSFTEDFFTSELVADKQGKGMCKGSTKTVAKVPAAAVINAELAKEKQGRMSTVIKGAFKIPTLRNIELTGPYMHNGSMKSLEEVVEFYNRGGNVSNPRHFSTLVFQQGFTKQQKADLVAFLKALTDERVRWERAPFDHPQIKVPHGHEAGENPMDNSLAADQYIDIPAVGKNGRSTADGPLKSFDSYLQP